MEAGLQRIVDAGAPYWSGVFVSYMAWGCLLVQVPTHYASSNRRTDVGIKCSVTLIFAFVSLGIKTQVQRTVLTFSAHYGDRLWLSNFHNLGRVHSISLYLCPTVVLLCHLVLTYRCFSFINALNGGSSPVRLAFAIVVTAISLGSYATGVLSIATYFSFRDYAAIDLASRTGSHMFDISQGSWLGSSLLVDVMLSAAISQELFKTLRDSRNDVGVGRNLQEVLLTLASITIRNGCLLVAFQVGILAAFLTSNPGWCAGALVALPCIQLSCLLSYLNTPKQTTQMQRTRARDEEEALATQLTHGGRTSQPPAPAPTPSSQPRRSLLLFSPVMPRRPAGPGRRKSSAIVSAASGKSRSSLLQLSSAHLHGAEAKQTTSETRRHAEAERRGIQVETSFVTSVQALELGDVQLGHSVWTHAPLAAHGGHIRNLSSGAHRADSPDSARPAMSAVSSVVSRERDAVGSFSGVVSSRSYGIYDPDMPTEYELAYMSAADRLPAEGPAPTR